MARIRRDDTVMVIAGKDKGKTGRVLKVTKGGDKVVVEKLNMVKRHQRPTQTSPTGGIVDKEMPLAISNVMLVHNNRAVRVGFQVKEVDGKRVKVRVAKQTGDVID